jgi:hypothetical protein
VWQNRISVLANCSRIRALRATCAARPRKLTAGRGAG